MSKVGVVFHGKRRVDTCHQEVIGVLKSEFENLHATKLPPGLLDEADRPGLVVPAEKPDSASPIVIVAVALLAVVAVVLILFKK
jgi:hypothetical protein